MLDISTPRRSRKCNVDPEHYTLLPEISTTLLTLHLIMNTPALKNAHLGSLRGVGRVEMCIFLHFHAHLGSFRALGRVEMCVFLHFHAHFGRNATFNEVLRDMARYGGGVRVETGNFHIYTVFVLKQLNDTF